MDPHQILSRLGVSSSEQEQYIFHPDVTAIRERRARDGVPVEGEYGLCLITGMRGKVKSISPNGSVMINPSRGGWASTNLDTLVKITEQEADDPNPPALPRL